MTILVVNGQTNQTNVKRSFYNTATGINRSGFHRFDSVAYLLWDIFNTPRAAGGVNGTAAEPGPGVRTLVDTGSVASIAGGVFTVSGNTSAGDPRLDEGSYARVWGRVFLLTTGDLSNQELFFGLSNNATPSATTGAPYFKSTGTTLQAVSTSGTARTIGVQADYTRYAVAARAIGGYLFGRLAAGGWRLLSIQAVDSTATIRPAVVCAVKTGASFTLDDWKTPDVLWIVPCLAYDTFTRSVGALGTSEYTGPDGQAAPVRTWTGATWTVSSNKAVNTPTTTELLANPGLEGTYVAGVAPNWVVVAGATLSEDNVVVHGGSAAQRVTTAATNDGVRPDAIAVTVGDWILASGWVYIVSGTTPSVQMTRGSVELPLDQVDTTTVGSWVQLIKCWRAIGSGNTNPVFRMAPEPAAAGVFVIDDATFSRRTLSTLFSSCGDLGTPDVLASADLVLTAGTQAGLLFNSDSTFHARINNAAGYEAGATEIALDAVTKAITASDTVTIAGTTYTIASVGSLSGQDQTITLSGGGLSAPVADNLDIGVNYATPNFGLLIHNGTNVQCIKCVNGVYTNLITAETGATYVAGKTIRVITYTSGSNLQVRAYWNDTFIGSEQAIGDAAIRAGRYFGKFSTYSANTFDNYQALARGTERQYAVLDTM